MTVGEAYKKGLETLLNSVCDDAYFDCDCLFNEFAEIDKTHRIINENCEINAAAAQKFFDAVNKRASGIPLQYILGYWEFLSYRFSVGEGVLIPRPETELLYEKAEEFIKESGARVIYDLCAGTGAIGLSVALKYPQCKVYLFEKYDGALKYLRKNKEDLNASNAEIIKYDIFDGKPETLEAPDLILSNPPYIKTNEISTLQREVQKEPATALDGGDDGLSFYRCIAEKWTPSVKKGGSVITECGDGQSDEIKSIFAGVSTKNTVYYDFNNIDRVIRFNV